jgi:ATP-dependent DNA helicase RecQ
LYGDEFLAVLAEFDGVTDTTVNDTVNATLELFKLGFGIEQVAQQRGLKADTVYSHLAKGLEIGVVRFEDVLDLLALQNVSVQEVAEIEAVLLSMPEDQRNALKPVYEQFGGAYQYGLLRCVRAALQWRLR